MTGSRGEPVEYFFRTIPPELSEGASFDQFRRQVESATPLSNPRIAPVLGVGTNERGLLTYTMRYVTGEWLPVRLRSGPIPLVDAVHILGDVATALDYAHRRRVVHGTLAPDKIILSHGTSVITDLGIGPALVAARGRPLVFAHVEGQPTLGDPAYLAPEQHTSTTILPSADIYAWGVIAYELLSGGHPFAGRATTRELMDAHAKEAPVHLLLKTPELPVGLCALVMACMEKDPRARPEAAVDLVRVLDDAALLDAPALEDVVALERTRWSVRVMGGLVVLLLAFLALGGTDLIARLRQTPASVADTVSGPSSAAGAAAITSITVLPFQSIGAPADDYLAEGLRAELARAISFVPTVRVAGASSSAALNDQAGPVQAAKALGVGGVVVATVQQPGTTIRLHLQLYNAQGKEMWNATLERPSSELLQLLVDATAGIVKSITPGVKTDVAEAFAVRARGTDSVGAYDLFLQARHGLATGTVPATERAIASLQRATTIDPSFTRALALQARAYLQLAGAGVSHDSTMQLALETARRALALDDGSADIHAAMGDASAANWRFGDATAQYVRAVDTRPGDAAFQLALARNLLAAGALDRATVQAQVALAANPISAQATTLVALTLLDARKFAESELRARLALTLDSTSAEAMRTVARAQIFAGHADSAIAILEPLFARDAQSTWIRSTLYLAYVAKGRTSDAVRLRLVFSADSIHHSDYESLVVALSDNNTSGAMAVLAQSAARGGDIPRYSESLGCDPLLDRLKSRAEYTSFMTTLGLTICSKP